MIPDSSQKPNIDFSLEEVILSCVNSNKFEKKYQSSKRQSIAYILKRMIHSFDALSHGFSGVFPVLSNRKQRLSVFIDGIL